MQILKLFKLFNYLLHKKLVAVGNGQWSSSNDNLDFLLVLILLWIFAL